MKRADIPDAHVLELARYNHSAHPAWCTTTNHGDPVVELVCHERERLLTQCTQVDEQIKEEKALVEQYRQALGQLGVTLTYVGAYAAPTH